MDAYVGSGGDRMPLIKYSAQDGSFRTSDRVNEGGQWRSIDEEIALPTQMVMDFENIEVGWIRYNPKPDFIMVQSGQPRPEQPDEKDEKGEPAYKWGFRVQLGNPIVGLRELSTSSKNVYNAMLTLYKAWEAGKAANPGMMPVVDISGSTRTEAGWRIPTWSIKKMGACPGLHDRRSHRSRTRSNRTRNRTGATGRNTGTRSAGPTRCEWLRPVLKRWGGAEPFPGSVAPTSTKGKVLGKA